VVASTIVALANPPAMADCIDDAAAHHRVNALVLRAIGWQESRLDPRATHQNRNGSVDIGAFQINSIHLAALARHGVAPAALADACVSAYVGAWHYASQVAEFGNTWTAVGAYHSRQPAHAWAYANGVASQLMRWGALAPGPLPFELTAPVAVPTHR
jgi:soluble lytic murein transglycosylase-like protein